MNYIDHDHKHTVKRGGSIMSGTSNYDDNVVINTPEYNKFDLSHTFRTSGKLGTINPCLNISVIAGDSLQITPSLFQRFRPLVSPVVTPIESSLHMFYVPLRTIDYAFDQFLTGGVDGKYDRPLLNCIADLSEFPHTGFYNWYARPLQWLVNGKKLFGIGSLLDEFNYGSRHMSYEAFTGMPTTSVPTNGKFNLFPLIAYHKVYNDYYRPEEIETDLFMPKARKTFRNYAMSLGEALGDGAHTAQEIVDALHVLPTMQGFAEYMLRFLTDPLLEGSEMTAKFADGIYDEETNSIHLVNLLAYQCTCSESGEQVDTKESYTHTLTTSGMLSDEKMATIALRDFMLYLLSADVMPWERDRYTTALPYLQRGISEYLHAGSPSAILPIQVDTGTNVSLENAVTVQRNYQNRPSQVSLLIPFITGSAPHTNRVGLSVESHNPKNQLYVKTPESGTQITMDDIRRLNAVTRFLEKSARVGYRFTDYLEGMFGVDTKAPSHLEKPVYIGGLKGSADINTVFNTADVSGSTLGDYAGAATSFSSNACESFSVPEHGVIIGVYGTKPRASYINTVDRNNLKYADRSLFYTPDFAHLQEQPLLNGDVSANFMSVEDCDYLNGKVESTPNFFGYEPRYNEYRSMVSTTHGELVTDQRTFTTSRDASDSNLGEDWEEFANDYAFQHCSPYDDCVNRVFAVDSKYSDHFIAEVSFNISKLSLMASQATPSL